MAKKQNKNGNRNDTTNQDMDTGVGYTDEDTGAIGGRSEGNLDDDLGGMGRTPGGRNNNNQGGAPMDRLDEEEDFNDEL